MRPGAQHESRTGVATAPDRDRFIDLIRVISMVAVVFLHWLSVLPALLNGKVVDQNVLAVIPGLWPLTWTGDVMALFFFAADGTLRRLSVSACARMAATGLVILAVIRSLPDRAFLFLHARGDPLLGVANADQLFAASANPASRLDVIAGHHHLDTYSHNPSRYMNVLLAFIDQQIGHPARA